MLHWNIEGDIVSLLPILHTAVAPEPLRNESLSGQTSPSKENKRETDCLNLAIVAKSTSVPVSCL